MEKECPLGGECEKCILYLDWYTTEKATEKVEHTKQCLFISQTQLLGDISNKLDRNQAAIESFRNETVKGQAEFNKLFAFGLTKKLKEIKGGQKDGTYTDDNKG